MKRRWRRRFEQERQSSDPRPWLVAPLPFSRPRILSLSYASLSRVPCRVVQHHRRICAGIYTIRIYTRSRGNVVAQNIRLRPGWATLRERRIDRELACRVIIRIYILFYSFLAIAPRSGNTAVSSSLSSTLLTLKSSYDSNIQIYLIYTSRRRRISRQTP